MSHSTYRKITCDTVAAFHLIEHLKALTGKRHRRIVFDAEEVIRIQVFISSRHLRIQACGANGDCGMRIRRLAFINGKRASDIGKAPFHGYLRHKHQAHARGELDSRRLWIDLPTCDVCYRILATVIGCCRCVGFPLLR